LELARPPGSITLGAVIRSFEGTTRILECVDTPGVCVIQPGCGPRHARAEAERRQMEYLDSVTIGNLVGPQAGLVTIP
jgi:Rrf2 family transcriptional regulator, nitric oxide-sensitive transcriptional repressor